MKIVRIAILAIGALGSIIGLGISKKDLKETSVGVGLKADLVQRGICGGDSDTDRSEPCTGG